MVEKGQKVSKITGSYYPFGLQHKGYNNVVSGGNDLAQNWKYSGKELNSELGLDWYDFGARNYDAALGRWMNVDPVADLAPSMTPYRYAFNNPLSFIDPDGLYEWRVNSETGEYERFGDKGGDEKQYVFFDDNEEATSVLNGSTIHVGAVSNNWYEDGNISYAVSTKDLWSDVPDEYQGAYTAGDLVERYKKQQEGGIEYQSIRKQENAGLARRDQIWNASDYGRYMDKKYGSRDGYIVAFDTRMLEEMFPGVNDALGGAHKYIRSFASGKARKFSPEFSSKGAAASVGSSQLSKNSWIRFLQQNKGKYKGLGLGNGWIKKAASDYNALKAAGKI